MRMNCLVVFSTVFAIVCPIMVMANTYTVGDAKGWTNGTVDYQAWAKGKTFRVGDKLVFKYAAAAHNVIEVNGTEYAKCIIPQQKKALATGNDEISLSTSGNKWYVCGVSNHCQNGGQKLYITVAEKESNNKATRTRIRGRSSSTASGSSRTAYEKCLVATFAALVIVHFFLS